MRVLLFSLLLLLVGGCAGVEADLYRVRMRESFGDLFRGADRGYETYAARLEESIDDGNGLGRYDYVEPRNVSHYYVLRSVHGLGGTELPDVDHLAFVCERLLYVLARDPTAIVRATACRQIGRLLLRAQLPVAEPVTVEPGAGQRIHQAGDELFQIVGRIDRGETVESSEILDQIGLLARERPESFLSAQQLATILSRRPLARSKRPPVRARADAVRPALLRSALLVALGAVAAGDPRDPNRGADESAIVRGEALEVLTRLAAPEAREAVAARLVGGLDPAERDADARWWGLRYLGAVGGAVAFDAALARLEGDDSSSLRLAAQAALIRMTGERFAPRAEAWSAWRDAHPEWQLRRPE